MVVEMTWAKPSLEGATCTRTLWPNGTLFEMVRFNKRNEGPDELTQDELDRWVESFPIQ
jgi:hypothetical protein